jgi:hypothetical protein
MGAGDLGRMEEAVSCIVKPRSSEAREVDRGDEGERSEDAQDGDRAAQRPNLQKLRKI